MGTKLAIKGHATRGKEVIKILEMLGGVNWSEAVGCTSDRIYYIIDSKAIVFDDDHFDDFIIFTLEEFLEKYPFKVGDFVFAGNWSYAMDIRQMHWNAKTQEVEYMVKPGATELWYTANKLTKYAMPKFNVGETVYNKHTHEFGEIIKYQWQKTEYIYLISHPSEDAWYVEKQLTNEVKPVDNENKMKNVLAELLEHIKTTSKEDLEKEFEDLKEWSNVGPTVEEFMTFCESVNRKPKYPTTYEECWKVRFEVDGETILEEFHNVRGYYSEPLGALQKLLCCRDAYWKIYGEQMGLGKPWEPDLENEELYCIQNYNKQITISRTNTAFNKILIFPTEEMRDVFFKNFKDWIEQCKEFL